MISVKSFTSAESGTEFRNSDRTEWPDFMNKFIKILLKNCSLKHC